MRAGARFFVLPQDTLLVSLTTTLNFWSYSYCLLYLLLNLLYFSLLNGKMKILKRLLMRLIWSVLGDELT